FQRDDSFQTRMERVANLGHSFCFGRIVTIARSSNKLVSRANSKDYFSEIRRKRNNSRDSCRQGNTSPGIVCQLTRNRTIECWFRAGVTAERDRKQQKPHDYWCS